jgi:hypothetical protein
MPDKLVRAMDPLGIVALAKVIVQQEQFECSCELKPGPGCSCENKPVPCTCQNECSCELKPVKEDIMEVLSNPIFREVVKGLDMNRLKSIEDFLTIADDIRAQMDSSGLPTRSTKKKKS